MKGYHQCLIDADSQLLTTFITPFGRFKYLHAPYGISSILEHTTTTGWQKPWKAFQDPAELWTTLSYTTAPLNHVRQFLQHCTEKQIALNPQKCKFGVTEVTFAGFRLSPESYQVDQSITEALSQFPKPTNHTNLHSFLGLVN